MASLKSRSALIDGSATLTIVTSRTIIRSPGAEDEQREPAAAVVCDHPRHPSHRTRARVVVSPRPLLSRGGLPAATGDHRPLRGRARQLRPQRRARDVARRRRDDLRRRRREAALRRAPRRGAPRRAARRSATTRRAEPRARRSRSPRSSSSRPSPAPTTAGSPRRSTIASRDRPTEDPHQLEGIDPEKLLVGRRAIRPYREWIAKKEAEGRYSWTLGLYGHAGDGEGGAALAREYWRRSSRRASSTIPTRSSAGARCSTRSSRVKQRLNSSRDRAAARRGRRASTSGSRSASSGSGSAGPATTSRASRSSPPPTGAARRARSPSPSRSTATAA